MTYQFRDIEITVSGDAQVAYLTVRTALDREADRDLGQIVLRGGLVSVTYFGQMFSGPVLQRLALAELKDELKLFIRVSHVGVTVLGSLEMLKEFMNHKEKNYHEELRRKKVKDEMYKGKGTPSPNPADGKK